MPENDILSLIGRDEPLLAKDLLTHEKELRQRVREGRFLVVGGAGSIGQAVVREIFARRPVALHVVDVSENNLVELVRDVRSSLGYIAGGFRTYAIDAGGPLFAALFEAEGPYDAVLNLSALKHVRSEKDPYTLARMLQVNILNVQRTLDLAIELGTGRYFSVSTDKAANPVNLMGASKRVMEMLLIGRREAIHTASARFANVAFSDGSLLHGFTRRMEKRQPLSAPLDVRRYFVTEREAGQLCLMAALLGESGDIFYPKLNPEAHLLTFAEIAERFLHQRGFEPHVCNTEQEARARVDELAALGRWPCYFFASDTTGEKPYEEFLAEDELADTDRYSALGVIHQTPVPGYETLERFMHALEQLGDRGARSKREVVELFEALLPELAHAETGKHLDDRM